jgi:very-short-patch-repair endonuclease
VTARWAPRRGESRQSDRSRANKRARRFRNDLTPTEKRLWQALRQLNKEGAQFRRQVALDNWTFDFGDLTARLLIEVDGGVHERLKGVQDRDAAKLRWAEANDFYLIAFPNEDIWERLDASIGMIRAIRSDRP